MKIWPVLSLVCWLVGGVALAKAQTYEAFESDSNWKFFTRLYRMDELPDGNWQTCIEWTNWRHNSWRIEASEQSHKYPLTYLFDDDARTAWVSSEKISGVSVSVLRPVMMDSVRIMNGYNRSEALFHRNNRVVKVGVWVNGKLLKTVRLSDKMGWHRISLPRQKVEHLGFDFNGVVRGQDNDICISGLEFYNGQRKINLRMPSVVLFDNGNPAEDPPRDAEFIARDGTRITGFLETRGGLGGTPLSSWSPNNRYVCDILENKNADQFELFVVDGLKRKVIWRRKLPASLLEENYSQRFFGRLDWLSNSTIKLTTAETYDEKGYVKPKHFTFRVR